MARDPLVVVESEDDARIALVRAEIALARVRTRASFDALHSEIRHEIVSVTDWRVVLRNHPACVAGAFFVAGFLYGNRR